MSHTGPIHVLMGAKCADVNGDGRVPGWCTTCATDVTWRCHSMGDCGNYSLIPWELGSMANMHLTLRV